jgi:hypothetical protein
MVATHKVKNGEETRNESNQITLKINSTENPYPVAREQSISQLSRFEPYHVVDKSFPENPYSATMEQVSRFELDHTEDKSLTTENPPLSNLNDSKSLTNGIELNHGEIDEDIMLLSPELMDAWIHALGSN